MLYSYLFDYLDVPKFAKHELILNSAVSLIGLFSFCMIDYFTNLLLIEVVVKLGSLLLLIAN